MTKRCSLWNSLAFFIGFVNMSAMLSAVRTNGTSSSNDSTTDRGRATRRAGEETAEAGPQARSRVLSTPRRQRRLSSSAAWAAGSRAT